MSEVKEIKRLSVAELLDGRTFFIPDYQRGYRWTSQQVEELLQDLLIFAHNEKGKNAYYCLQPIVVRDIEEGILEVIDGQQRLTTLKIILHFLQNDFGKDRWEKQICVGTYKITYETREKSNDFIEKLGTDAIGVSSLDNDVPEPIDFYFMRNAYQTVSDWFNGEGDFGKEGKSAERSALKIKQRLKEDDTPSDLIRKLLVNKPGGNFPTAQVLWYNVDDKNNNKDGGISLFNRLNTGKLELTDAELIKGLFLLKANFSKDANEYATEEQLKMAIKWEQIENAMHRDDFWSFLNRRKSDKPNRIDLLLELVCRYSLKGKESDITRRLEEKHGVFNYYNNEIFNVDESERQGRIEDAWKKIEKGFFILEDWYSEPVSYNLIGFLCQSGVADLFEIFDKYQELQAEKETREEFIGYLKDKIRDYFKNVSITCKSKGTNGKELDYAIDLSYKEDKEMIRSILLLLNVEHMNRRILGTPKLKTGDGLEHKQGELRPGELDLCKFPFAVLADSWDIEHVDSQAANELDKPKDQEDWARTSLAELEDRDKLTPEERSTIIAEIDELKKPHGNNVWQHLLDRLRESTEEEKGDPVDKHNIKNLVLLDASTNRAYQNALFVRKRKTIIERRECGQYVPETTSYVFFKLFEKSVQSSWHWTQDDMQFYVNYIVSQLNDYLPEAKEAK